MSITATELKSNLGKYLLLAATENKESWKTKRKKHVLPFVPRHKKNLKKEKTENV